MGPRRPTVVALAAAAALGAGLLAAPQALAAGEHPDAHHRESGCVMRAGDHPVDHVIYLTFDNVHFTRDNPNVPSDLEQMPHLLDFLEHNGTLDSAHHTPLIAHTGNDILTQLTGLYGGNHGQPVSNSYRYYKPDGTSASARTFAYWTDGIADPATPTPGDTAPTMVTPDGRNTPAPWTAYTRAGCDFGTVSTANTVLENTTSDIDKVFGPGSPEAAEAKADPVRAQADIVGIGVHCAQGSAHCATPAARPDLLPDEPGGYHGYRALYGARSVDAVISPDHPVRAIGGAPVTDKAGNPGFPGFDSTSADNTLGYLATMQEAGVPVTYGYISDAHDRYPGGSAYGPGEAGYVAQLKAYDQAFDGFFQRLAKDGITPANSLFVVTSDENDHFVGGKPSPAGCDGVTTPCSYQRIGEINANVRGLLATQQHLTTPFQLKSESAPSFYLDGNPAPDATTTRDFERAVSELTAVNPLTGTTDAISHRLADRAEMKLLHMVTGDPLRTATFTDFLDPNYLAVAGAANCATPCVGLNAEEAWNHGDFAPDINTTWLGLAGPGVRRLGATGAVWSDHTDIRPTMLALLGLHDVYAHDGRVLTEFLAPRALPRSLRAADQADNRRLAADYKQLNAGVGEFASATLAAATTAAASDTPGDTRYKDTEAKLVSLGEQRDRLARQIGDLLDPTAPGSGRLTPATARNLARQAEDLIHQADQLARG
ncbi:hypothetical protein AB0C76_17720 [Kitasatospora sp. NPDC048722]|uniref:hypothetical protein n=1 Tax=Kitasatospora sp. NPDC048722 TaxID=3155639 RepID=UPI0034056512